MTGAAQLLSVLALIVAVTAPAAAFDATTPLHRGALGISVEAGMGSQDNFEAHVHQTGLELAYVGLRLGLVPFEPIGRGLLASVLEIGIEPVYQRYTHPVTAYFAGLGVMLRHHFVGLGRLVPYLEAVGAAGATNLEAREIDSEFTFWLAAGAGASVFVSERMAIYAGYRLVHVSNGNTSIPNRGFEAHTGLAGVSYFFR
jgi:opacity protein-like surface antigen